ncbi:NUDIX domain-containing protein [Streptomyces sp. NBC_00873]|nr:NUDIX domain-containing protein [Streptomyces sp. NBC_00873]WTA48651.1 NUDIX domain-containing protein [Streptomyces sp. NBC_00842]
MPEAGTQVPAGGAKSGERLEEAVLREVAEETGLLTATVVRQIAVEDKPHPDTGQPRRTSFFFLQAPADTYDAWDHQVNSDGDDAGLTLPASSSPFPWSNHWPTIRTPGWAANGRTALRGGTRRTLDYAAEVTAPRDIPTALRQGPSMRLRASPPLREARPSLYPRRRCQLGRARSTLPRTAAQDRTWQDPTASPPSLARRPSPAARSDHPPITR